MFNLICTKNYLPEVCLISRENAGDLFVVTIHDGHLPDLVPQRRVLRCLHGVRIDQRVGPGLPSYREILGSSSNLHGVQWEACIRTHKYR